MNDTYVLPAPDEEDAYLCRVITTLTCRERVALLEIASDLSNAEIAEHMRIQPKSVENYRTRIADKLDFKDARVLARFARRHRAKLREIYELLTGMLPPPRFSYIWLDITG